MIVRSGRTPNSSWAPPRATRKPVMTSSKTSSASARVGLLAQEARGSPARAGRGPCSPRSARRGSPRARARRPPPRTPRDRSRAPRPCPWPRPPVTPGAGRDPLRREARAALGQQAVDVAVVGAGELQHLVAAGGRARQAHRAHRGLGARVDQPHHLHRRHALRRPRRPARPRPRSAPHSWCPRPPPPAPPRRPAGWRGRGSAGPTSRPSRRSGGRRRRSARRPRRAR